MQTPSTISGFSGELVRPADQSFDQHREVWNAIVDRRPALIARCTSGADVAAATRFGRDSGLEIAVKCGGHSILGLSVPDGDATGRLVGSSTEFNPDTGNPSEEATAASSDPLAPGKFVAGTWSVKVRGYLVLDPQTYTGTISVTAAK